MGSSAIDIASDGDGAGDGNGAVAGGGDGAVLGCAESLVAMIGSTDKKHKTIILFTVCADSNTLTKCIQTDGLDFITFQIYSLYCYYYYQNVFTIVVLQEDKN